MIADELIKNYLPENVAGKNIVITGGTAGIGRATAALLAQLGANVFVAGRTAEHLENTLKEAAEKNYPGKFQGIVADLASKEGITKLFAETDQRFSQLDVLINNAGLAAQGIDKGSFDEWQDVIQSNLLNYIACSHEAYIRMKPNKSGHIINVGSMSSDIKGAGGSVYTATKSGIQGYTESLRKEVNEAGIKVTLIEPGLVGTDMQEKSQEEQQQQQDELKMLKAEDIAAAVYYALIQPRRCDVIAIKIRPHLQLV
jgi:NADP-dependent 3-hydroxy acid dehydrogenase YdfG